MKNKITLLFAALMMTLGVSAQEGTTVEERGAAKGYYPFAAEVTEMEQITSLAQLTDGMEIMIKHSHEGTNQDNHEGSYLTIYSLPTYGAAHIVFMQEKPVGVGVWTTNTVSAQDGTFKLQSAHGAITNSTCYLGKLGWNLTTEAYLSTTGTAEYVGVYKFVPATDGSGRWNIQCTNNSYKTYLSVTADSQGSPTISEAYSIDKNCYFEIYGVKEKSTEQVKYVENAQVKFIGPSGNIVTTTHTGWSDFYEFVMYSGSAQNSVNYGVSISNELYHESENLITASIKYAFPISGDVAKIPVHLCPKGSENLRISIVDGNLKVVEKPANGWVKDKNNQWYIFPIYDNKDFTYAIQNVGTGQYINFTSTYTSSNIITLGQTPSYFTLGANTTGTYLNFEFKYTNDKSATYTYCLYGDTQDLKDYNKNLLIPAYQLGAYSKNSYYTAENFLVPAVSAAELDGVPAIGFTRYFHEDAYFWDGGEIADENIPDAVKANLASSSHEGYNAGVHKVFSAETGITVPQTGNVTAQFDFISGMNTLQILGVDIVKRDDARTVVSFDYHLGKAGTPSQNNLYVLENVEAEDYYIRYWVCNRTDLNGWEGHNLKNVRGKIEVKGANYDYTPIDALENGQFPVNTTWYRMRLQDGLGKYISAHPDYMDEDNYLKLSNNTPPSDYAGLWAIVGNETDGYKFYNRAWGPEYAMKTTGENGDARTFMAPAKEATSYDIVRDLDAEDISARYKYYVKVHGTDHNYLNDHANNGYLRTWNTAVAGTNADGSGSVMTFETLNMEDFEANTTIVKNTLAEKWTPWTAEPEVADIIDDFAQLMLNRNSFALLNGKVFKFANKGTDDRKDMLLTVNGEGKGAGVAPTDKSKGYMQFIDNGDGTFKLFHIATARYLGVPEGAVTTTESSKAAAYTYTFQDAAQKEQLTFETADQTLHLNNTDFTLMNWKNADDASRWTVFYGETEAQELGAVAIEAQKMLEEITSADYLAGQPGYASQELIEEYKTTIQGLSDKNLADAKTTLEAAMKKITDAEKYIQALTQLSNTGIYGIHCERAPLAYVEDNSNTHLSTPMVGSTVNIPANVVNNENEQFAILRTENTPAGWYYLYNITTQKFVSKDFTLTENPVCAVNFRDISGYDADYRWEVWFGEIIDGKKVDAKLNVNSNPGLALNSYWEMDEGNKFRIEFAKTNEEKTAPALAAIIAFETAKAKADATAFLNDTPETVGYPLEAARTTFANAIVAAASISEVETAKANFVASRDIVMPENGKAYKISAWWRGRTWPLTFVDNSNKPGYACATPAYAPVENGTATVFVCRKLENGTYAFVSDNGYYLGWQTDAENTNATNTEFAGATYWKVEKSRADNNSGGLNSEEIFGKVNIVAERTSGSWYDYMFNCDDKKFHNGQPGAKHYGDNGNTVYYTFEEVGYTLNKVTLTAFSDDDELINDLEGSSIATFSAPYATVIPEGVTAYYAKATSTGAENSSAILDVVEGAIPAGEGVILVGKTAGQVEMLPVAGETKATLENNYLIGTGAIPVEMQTGDFILAIGNQGIGFYQANGTLRAGKAYIQFGGAVNSLVLRFGGNTTDIDAVTTVTPSNDELIYDIYGRRVTEVKKGNIYIKNGKKFIVK